MATTRLLTLTGTGGCGKTRLALRLAAQALPGVPDGVWLVELAASADNSLVLNLLSAALGVREAPSEPLVDGLVRWLQPKQLLLVLDNCEHVLEGCSSLVGTLLRRCPHLHILATSREELRLTGEALWRVPGLAVPPDAPLAVDASKEYAAVRLFAERAEAGSAAFQIRADNVHAVARICRRLDGLPLAIELAAARVRLLSPQQLATRLDDRFRVLTGGSRTAPRRQQTRRAAIDWSYDLLTKAEQVLFDRLSVFAGGWTLETAEDVCAGGGIARAEVLDLLDRIVEQSVVLAEYGGTGAIRYHMLETIRQHAQERLRESGDAHERQSRYLDWCARMASQADEALRGPGRKVAVDLLGVEHDNLRATLHWSATQDATGGTTLRLVGNLWWFWYVQGHWSEGRSWLRRALAHSSTAEHAAAYARASRCGDARVRARRLRRRAPPPGRERCVLEGAR